MSTEVWHLVATSYRLPRCCNSLILFQSRERKKKEGRREERRRKGRKTGEREGRKEGRK
jgi:hypothetical protein